MKEQQIIENVERLLEEIPEGVKVVAAAKQRSAREVAAVVKAGITQVGHNYVQEAQAMRNFLGNNVRWHMIGHLQRNKVKKAIQLFDVIETLDSRDLGAEINKQSERSGIVKPVLVEVNSGQEANKAGVIPGDAVELIEKLSKMKYLKVIGLMTMGPFLDEPEGLRPYFQITRRIFEEIATSNIPGIKMKYLSMGMSDSYQIAIDEGANLVRIGTKIFGPRT
jgi:pyridoxal phosphate enzyme (YggS family)